MMAGSKISCMGIVGDGCGGGREFIVQDAVLYAYDSITSEKIILLNNIKNPKKITKDGCLISIDCENEKVIFDLSTFKQI